MTPQSLYLSISSLVFTFVCVSTLLLSACGKNELRVLPTGVQTLTGTVLPSDISLLRRGTHLFRIDDEDVYFLESTGVSLRSYEHKHVVLEGTLSPNIDDTYLPLLTVDRIISVLEQSVKEWHLRSFALTFELPDSWGGSIETDSAAFIPLGAQEPVVSFSWLEEIIDTSNDENPLDYNSVPIIVGGVRATKSIDEEAKAETVRVVRPSGTIEIVYTVLDHPNEEQWHTDWLSLLSTVQFDPLDTPTQPTGSGAAKGAPCGGHAGILCPTGFYCDVENLQENIGVCTSL